MERLTYWCPDGKGGGEWRANVRGTEIIGEEIDRLAAYEDTGLDPRETEEIAERLNENIGAANMWSKRYYELAADKLGATFDHLRSLVEAEQNGRLLVLPCKVGDTVYILPLGLGIEGDFITEAEVLSISSNDAMFRVKYKSGQLDRYTWSAIGKTVFLTREAAEQALEGGKA